jgi:toxin ParE1/3/4
LVVQFDQQLDSLACTPLMGKSADEFSPGLRSFPVGSYLIFYRPIVGGIELARLLHGARDITTEFFGE